MPTPASVRALDADPAPDFEDQHHRGEQADGQPNAEHHEVRVQH
jgi:hypothetical protein